MGAPIALISPDEGLYDVAIRLQQELPFSYDVHLAYLDHAVQLSEQLIREGARVLVSRGGTLRYLRQSIETVPIVEIPFSDIDTLSLLMAAKDISPNIVFIGFSSSWMTMAEKLAKVMKLTIKTYIVDSEREVIAQVEHAVKHDHAGVIVGAKLAHDAAKKMGVPAILLDSSEMTVKTALLNAASSLHALDQERLRNQQQATILNNIDAGLVILDPNGTVVQYNESADQIFELHKGPEKLQGALADLLSGKLLSSTQINDKLIRMESRKLLCSVDPVLLDGQTKSVLLRVDTLNRVQEMEQKSRQQLAEQRLQAKHVFDDVLCKSSVMMKVKERARKYAVTDLTIMIRGESGTGKELLAQSIHNASSRRKGPFVAINCGALPDSILESELFGYVDGAFTGARKGGKMGVFELAHTGTIFLDEIGEMSLAMQSRLLRVLEEGEITRLGDIAVRPVDVRVICATNKDLEEMIRQGTFRRDLYYRVQMLEVVVPPLCERIADAELLMDHFLHATCSRMDAPMPRLSPEARARLLTYPWPGNVREVRNVASRLCVEFPGEDVSEEEVCAMLDIPRQPEVRARFADSERDVLLRALDSCNGNKKQAAQLLGISQSTFWRKAKKLGL